MRTSPNESSSLGTLIDLASYSTEYLRTPGLSPLEIDRTSILLEQTLALCSTQAALWVNGKGGSKSSNSKSKSIGNQIKEGESGLATRSEIDAGVTRDLLASITAANSALIFAGGGRNNGNSDSEGEDERNLFLNLLEQFVKGKVMMRVE